MINVCRKFALLVILSVESEEKNNNVLSLTCRERVDNVVRLIGEHQDLFQEVWELPPKQAMEHEIQLISDAPLPNLGMCKTR